MEYYLIYIGKVAIAAGAFYLVFHLLFQNQKQFAFNRIYLPVSLFLSFMIPLITYTTVNYVEPLPVQFSPVPVFTESFEPAVPEQHKPEYLWEWHHWLFAVYIAGIALFLFRLLLGHLKASQIIRESRMQELFKSMVNISKRDIHPFSFFNKIVLSENTLFNPQLEMIVAHEKIHVKEKHTFDILLTEILFLFQWFNPFAWLMKDAVKNNLEYKTDHEIVKANNIKTYQLAMLMLADKQGVAPFLTALNGSQLRSRIIMMKRKNKNKYALLKQLVVLPLLAVLVMGLAEREVRTEIIRQDTTGQVQNTLPATNQYDISKLLIMVDGEIIPSDSPELKHIILTEENRHNSKYVIEIIEALNISMDDITGSRSSMNPGNPYLYLRTKNYIPGTNKAFEENFEKPSSIKERMFKQKELNYIHGKITNEKGQPIEGASVVVEGRQLGVVTNSQGNYRIEVDPDDKVLIFGFLYHPKKKVTIEGKDKIDVVIPTYLEPPTSGAYMSSSFKMRNSKNELVKPIFLINDKEVNIEEVDRHFVKSFRMLPDSTAVRLYGEKGKNGIVVLTMKNPEEMQTISGKITNENGEPVIGASITEYDDFGRAVHGTHSDRTGHYDYIIKQENSSVRVRHFDYQTKELDVKGKKIIDVQLERNLFQLSEMKIVIDGNIIPSNTPQLKTLNLSDESLNNGRYVMEILEALGIPNDDVVGSKGSVTANNSELYIRTKNYKPGTNPEFEKMTEMPVARIEAKVKKEEGEPAGKLRYTIAGIEVSGIRYLDKTVLMQLSGLQVGQNIEVPGEMITNATKKLWQQGLFSDVKITASKIADNKVWLDIFLQEKNHPQNSNQNDSIIIRGLRSLGNGRPLVVIDGVPQFRVSQNFDIISADAEAVSKLTDVPLQDIKSIEVYKDDASTAVYGPQGKEGVINIITKSGSARNAPVYLESDPLEPVFVKVDEMPEFPGGEFSLRMFIAKNLKYPVKAQESGVQGEVYVSFIIDKEGKISDAKIAKGVHELLDQEALRVVNLLPAWKPGKHEGKYVNVYYTLPVYFGLQN